MTVVTDLVYFGSNDALCLLEVDDSLATRGHFGHDSCSGLLPAATNLLLLITHRLCPDTSTAHKQAVTKSLKTNCAL